MRHHDHGHALVGQLAHDAEHFVAQLRIQLEDQNIAFKAESQIAQKLGNTARVNAMVYGGHVLLTGDAPTEEAKAQATAIA
ncbi:BON domain protein [Bordetella bronchiseptica B20-10725633]|nr:BON domain protein [Bordetella bronchiseptica B20-10725633]